MRAGTTALKPVERPSRAQVCPSAEPSTSHTQPRTTTRDTLLAWPRSRVVDAGGGGVVTPVGGVAVVAVTGGGGSRFVKSPSVKGHGAGEGPAICVHGFPRDTGRPAALR